MDKDVQEYLINKIKSEYTEKTDTEFDTLMKLDREIKLPPTIFNLYRRHHRSFVSWVRNVPYND